VAKDRARPFSRKHRRYWIPVTGGMVLIGVINVALGYCSYTTPSDHHEPIVPDVPSVAGRTTTAAPPSTAGCTPAILRRVEADMPGVTITGCTPGHASVLRGEHPIELTLAGDAIVEVAEALTRPEIPAEVMLAFAVAYPQTIPSGAIKRTRRGSDPVYEVGFPPGAPHAVATLRGDGSVISVR
jgi:hypothetical protein